MKRKNTMAIIGFVVAGGAFLCLSGPVSAQPGGQPGADEPRPGAGEPAKREATPADPAPREPARRADGISPEDKATAKKHFAAGGELFSKGKYDQAIVEFNKAWSYWKNRNIKLNIAICYSEKGDHVQAVSQLREALKGADDATVTKIRGRMPAKLKASETKVAVLKVTLHDPQAEILVNGTPEGRGSLEKVMMPGSVLVQARSGENKAKKTLVLTAGQTSTWNLSAWPVITKPGNGKKPKKGFKLGRLPIWYFIGAAALTVVGGAVLIGTGIQTGKYRDDYLDNPDRDTRDTGIQYRNATNAMVGITVAAGLAAAALAVFTDWKNPFRKKEKAGSTSVQPFFGPGGAGMTLTCDF